MLPSPSSKVIPEASIQSVTSFALSGAPARASDVLDPSAARGANAGFCPQ